MTEKDMMDGIRKAYKELDAYFDTLAEECDPETKLAVTRWAQRKYDQSQNSLLRRIQELMAIG